MLIEKPKKTWILLAVVAALIATGCSPSTTGRSNDALTAAIRLYIDGKYEDAARRFDAISRDATDEDDVLTAYLYLGRCYMELGDYVAAGEAFTSGRILGGGLQFDGLLADAQEHLRMTSRNWGGETALSRAQLAVLIDARFGDRLQGGKDEGTPADLIDHWAREPADRMSDAGVIRPLADGNFYPDAPVTPAAFYVTLVRLSRAAGIPESEVVVYFPNGLRGAVAAVGQEQVFVNAGEATRVLTTLAQTGR